MMQHVADAFTAAAVLVGLWAALLWWRSGRVQVKAPPGVDPRGKAAVREAIGRTDTLNGHAALWTAASVALQAGAAVFARLAMP